ncbi:MAG: AAA family ATPase [Pseudomonadota bacterium]|nr:AAA family ATPase [Pseudomonadota bacterium]
MINTTRAPYLAYFGLQEPPFRLVPDTSCFFTGAQRGRTLQALVYAITQGEGIIRITGEVGAGKTMLCRMLLQELPDSVDIAYLAVPSLDRQQVLRALARELDVPCDDVPGVDDLLERLQQELIERHAEGFHVAVLVDEAHAMPAEALEQIRLLSNLETRSDKLLHIVLFGQPELDTMLDQPELRALADRISHTFHLAPMDDEEVAAYLELRLRSAGYTGGTLFRRRAVHALAEAAGGMARRVNILADRSLLAAFAHDSRSVHARHVALAVNDGRSPPAHRLSATWVAVGTGMLTGALITLALLKVLHP